MSSSEDAGLEYVLKIAKRIVLMFQRYRKLVDVTCEEFENIVQRSLPQEVRANPKAIPYAELYKMLKHIIDEYAERKEGS